MAMFHTSYFFVEYCLLYWLKPFIIHCALFRVFLQVVAFNGKPVKNLKSLAAMVESCDDEYLKFDLDYEQVRLYWSLLSCVLMKMALINTY